MKIGYFLSSEEWGPRDLVSLAGKAERAGFEGLWISDHYHPWNEEQGHGSFVWSVIGAIAQTTTDTKLTTAVTCPTVRLHPRIVAQAAATAAILLDGRFCLGLGSGEALNEHSFGDPWPGADERHLPSSPPPIVVSGFGRKSVELAAKIGDGYCTVGADADSVDLCRSRASNGRLVQGGLNVCWDEDESAARSTAHRLWRNDALPGELAQALPTTEHFEQASELVTEELLARQLPCGPDLDRHVEAIDAYGQAGFDELYIQQISPRQDDFFETYRDHVLPRVR
jgi:alkanesulfonate monooxygenase SsuD/methylene tetrahydromethanopterin reductase-like flavin-dependent oxidoreductase (luciferase family)